MATKTKATENTETVTTIADDVCAFLDRFIVFPDQRQRDAVALWVIHTWAFDAAYATPYLYVNSAERECGKTRTIEVTSALSRNPMSAADMTSASMFRVINDRKPSIFIDEVDTIFSGAANESLRNFLNSGYKHGGKTYRFTGKDSEEFSTFCPKLLAGIDNGKMPDTIDSRCIKIVLKRKKADTPVERWLWRKVEGQVEELTQRIEAWATENMGALKMAEPDIIDTLGDRAFEIAEPLLAIADRLRGWHQRAIDALTFLQQAETPALSPQAQVLTLAREWFDGNEGVTRMPSALLAELCGINTMQVSVYLKPYGITPKTRRIDGVPTKLYERSEFVDAWERYI